MNVGKTKLLLSGLILLAIFLLAACASLPTPSPTVTVVPPTVSRTPAMVLTSSPSATPTESEFVEPTPTAPPYTRCQEIIDAQLPEDFLTEGSIIFSGECYGKQGWYKLSATTRKITPFLDGIVEPYQRSMVLPERHSSLVSIDSQWLAIQDLRYERGVLSSTRSLIVTGEDDSAAIRYPMNRNWWNVTHWLRNGLLNIRAAGSPKMNLLDPFTGKISVFHYSFPEDMNIDQRLRWIYFDNVFAREAYIDESLHYKVREISSNRLLYTSNTRYFYWETPQWSPNGEFLSFTNRGDGSETFKFIAVDRNGKERITEENFYIDEPGFSFSHWSPNGKYLSILTAVSEGKEQIVLWNPETNQITNPAVPAKYFLDFPKFSPNEEQFIINATEDSEENPKTINYLVDLSSGKVTELDLNLKPMAWLKTNKQATKPKEDAYPLPPQSGSNVNQVCLRHQPAASIPAFGGGLVLFQDEYLSVYTSNKGIHQLTKTYFGFVSPNREWLFYWHDENLPVYERNFWLFSLNKPPMEVAKEKNLDKLPHAVSGWFDNDELWVDNSWISPYGDENGLFNPFDVTLREAPEFKQNEFGSCSAPHCQNNYSPEFYKIYDRNFQRYITFVDDDYPDGTLIMQDRDAKVMWKLSRPLVGFNMPKWQPGDQFFAIPMPKDETDDQGEHYEIFIVDRDGHQTKLTNYAAAYPTMTIDKFSWSPNGRYIAFWGDTHSQKNIAQQHPYRLFVLDTVTQQTIDYCVARNYSVEEDDTMRAPVWSPDGNQIAVNGFLDGKRTILLVDFASGTVSPVAEGQLIGWMAEP